MYKGQMIWPTMMVEGVDYERYTWLNQGWGASIRIDNTNRIIDNLTDTIYWRYKEPNNGYGTNKKNQLNQEQNMWGVVERTPETFFFREYMKNHTYGISVDNRYCTNWYCTDHAIMQRAKNRIYQIEMSYLSDQYYKVRYGYDNLNSTRNINRYYQSKMLRCEFDYLYIFKAHFHPLWCCGSFSRFTITGIDGVVKFDFVPCKLLRDIPERLKSIHTLHALKDDCGMVDLVSGKFFGDWGYYVNVSPDSRFQPFTVSN